MVFHDEDLLFCDCLFDISLSQVYDKGSMFPEINRPIFTVPVTL